MKKLKIIKLLAMVASAPRSLNRDGVDGWQQAMAFIVRKIEEEEETKNDK